MSRHCSSDPLSSFPVNDCRIRAWNWKSQNISHHNVLINMRRIDMSDRRDDIRWEAAWVSTVWNMLFEAEHIKG